MDNPPFAEILEKFKNSPRSLLWQIPGIFPINKPSGITSHDVISHMRRHLNMRRVGHGGTLDPMAQGLLLVFTANATRLFDCMQEFDKEYLAGFTLGIQTDTQDTTGEVINQVEPADISVSPEELQNVVDTFKGKILQVPPMFSALKYGGKKLYELAREGKTVERQPREMEVFKLEIVSFDGIGGELLVSASKGFYVRTLIEDIGLKLGTYACMNALTRTRIGPFSLEEAKPLTDFQVRPRSPKQSGQ